MVKVFQHAKETRFTIEASHTATHDQFILRHESVGVALTGEQWQELAHIVDVLTRSSLADAEIEIGGRLARPTLDIAILDEVIKAISQLRGFQA